MEHMYDLAEKREVSEVTPDGGNKEKKHYPTVYLDSKQLPVLKEIKIGKEVSLHVKGIIKSIRQEEDKISYDIELRECGLMGHTTKDAYEDMPEEEKDKADEKEVMGEE